MGLEQIFAKISEDTRREAQNIINSASGEASQILGEAKKEAAFLKEDIIAGSRNEEEFSFRKEIISGSLLAKREILQSKKSLLNDCFSGALEEIINLDEGPYRNLIKNMLAKIDFREKGEIIFSIHDKGRISQDFIHKINPRLELSFADNIKGGFILKAPELIMDNSLANILEALHQGLEPEVAEILFNEV